MMIWILAAAASFCSAADLQPELLNYRLGQDGLRLVSIDKDASESFLALDLDSAGRLFAGAREGVFVYEPAEAAANTPYQPRQLLYRFPKDSWVYGLAIRGEDLYVATHTAIYILEGAVHKRSGLKPKRLVWGMPMLPFFEEHQGVHALAFGPDGDLYFSVGDNLVNYGDFKRADHWGHWTFFHGNGSTPVTTVGMVARITPDGGAFAPIARGLRNCCGLAFDARWNLFGNDNDHESLPNEYVPGRLVHLTSHAYYSWPRGWLPEKHPWRTDLLETLNPSLGRYVPTGQACYDEKLFPENLRNNLLVAEWGKGVLLRYPLQPSGATYKAAEFPLLSCSNNVRPVGVAIGRGGRIFVSSLTMAGNEASPLCASEIVMITRADDAPGAPFEGYEEVSASLPKLFEELGTDSASRRRRAHIELTRRGSVAFDEATKRLTAAPDGSPLQSSLIWLAAAGGATREIEALTVLPNASTRFQAGRALTRFASSAAVSRVLRKALEDSDSAVKHAALTSLFEDSENIPFDLVAMLAQSPESFLRQTAAQLLAEKASLAELESLAESPKAETRMAGVLCLGFKMTVPPATGTLSPDFPLNTNGFKSKVQYDGGTENLALKSRVGVFTIAEAWSGRPHTPKEEKTFDLLARRLDDADAGVAREAAFFLRLLKDPRVDAKAAERLGIRSAGVANAPIARARAAEATEWPVELRGLDWEVEARRGDAKKGKDLFVTRGCVVCHQIQPNGQGGGGPSLLNVGSRFNAAYLAESIIIPNKTVAPMFRWTFVRLKTEEELAGLVVGETAEQLDFLLPSGLRRAVKKTEIDHREIQERSPMPEGLIQTAEELRDLLAYLISQK
ncbi:MAG TPA: c-type cytochrome [Verrucomicrobiae bacterium]|jgi:putative heme-binding domain-containing protein|nr:c-type cytochrome [Verrucomicrobiae bacterium]